MFRPFRALVAFLPRLWSNWLTLLGAVITSITAVTVLAALAIDLLSSGLNTYAAAILFLILPVLCALGLALIPLGLYLERRQARRKGTPPLERDRLQEAVVAAMSSPTVRKRVAFVLLMTGLNVLLFATVTHRAITFMETPQFCGNACHSVMQPEFDAYKQSPHSRVACVQCHVGDGAGAAVAAKLSGLRQVWGIATGTFHRPIETPVHNLRAARETCEGCHQARKFFGVRLGFRTRFKEDKDNSPQVTALMLPLGGVDPRTGQATGIHSHIGSSFQIRYEVLDAKRNLIGKIQRVEDGKVVTEWLPPKDRTQPVLETRVMDCVDCHNRPTHIYDGTPENAINKALGDGTLDRGMPWLRQVGLGVLKTATPPREQAEPEFRRALDQAYRQQHGDAQPTAAQLNAAAHGLAALYLRNVYPHMHLSWNNYPSNIGHGGPDPGSFKGQCFRCHGGEHQTAAGKPISSKCELCHDVIAKGELPKDLPDEIQPFLRL